MSQPVERIIDLRNKQTFPEEVRRQGYFDFVAISRIEIYEQAELSLALDTVPLIEARKIDLRTKRDDDRGVWPYLPENDDEIIGTEFSLWRTLRTGWPGASYLRVLNIRNRAPLAFFRGQLNLPILPDASSLAQSLDRSRAETLEKSLFGTVPSPRITREDWGDLHFDHINSLTSLTLAIGSENGPTVDGLSANTSLLHHVTSGTPARPNRSQSSAIRRNVVSQANGDIVFRRRATDTLRLRDAVAKLGTKTLDSLPLSRLGLTSVEAGPSSANDQIFALELALLQQIGLATSPVAATPEAGKLQGGQLRGFPFQHLHTRKSEQEGGRLEWLVWIKLAHPHSEDPDAATPCLLRLREKDNSTADGRISEYTVTLEGLSDEHVLHFWSLYAAGPARNSFARKYGREVPSLLPNLVELAAGAEREDQGNFMLELDCRRVISGAEFHVPGQGAPALQPNEIRAATLRRMHRNDRATRAVPFPPAIPRHEKLGVVGETVSLNFEDLYASDGQPVTVQAGEVMFGSELDELVFRRAADGALQLETDHTLSIAKGVTAFSELEIAIASLDVRISGRLAADADRLHLDGNGEFNIASLRLPIVTVHVTGTDADSSVLEERQAAVWSTDGSALIEGGQLELSHNDTEEGRESSFNIYRGSRSAGSSGRFEVATIDPAPFFIGAVSMTSPAGGDKDENELVASWRSTDKRWRMQWQGDGVAEIDLRLPAQGIAEDWERSNLKADGKAVDGIAEGGRVAARFTRPAKLRVEAEESAKAPSAAWNLVETLSEVVSDLPGMRMTALDRLEILYGLETHGGRPENVRLAETEGWQGRPALLPVALESEAKTETDHRATDWLRADRLWVGRLAVIEARQDRPREGSLMEEVPYRIRRHVQDGAEYARPLVTDDNADIGAEQAYIPYTNPDNDAWWTDDGTTGGVFGGFERPEVIDALIRDAETGRGAIRKLALSARGASSDGDSLFGTGLTKISYKSESGRLTEVRFEREGRISWFRHRARHVIVYRRRATPGLQFGGIQDENRGRLIMRKDEEFVQLIEPKRDFPGKNTAALNGFLFRDQKILVNGAWSRGVEEEGFYRGYSIPLWRPEADAKIYPRPDCACIMAGADTNPVLRSVANPQIIRFYSLTEIKGKPPNANTEVWPNIYGIDFADRRLGEPFEDTDTVPFREDFGDPSEPARPLPGEELVHPGLEDFTLLLEPGLPMDIADSRGEPVSADLRSVVVMRAKHGYAPGSRNGSGSGSEPKELAQRITTRTRKLASLAITRPQRGGTVANLEREVQALKLDLAAFKTNSGDAEEKILSFIAQPVSKLKSIDARLEPLDTVEKLNRLWIEHRSQLVDNLTHLEQELAKVFPINGQLFEESERLLGLKDGEEKLEEEIAKFFTSASVQVGKVIDETKEALTALKSDVENQIDVVIAELDIATPDFAKARRLMRTGLQQLDTAEGRFRLALRKVAERAPHVAKYATKFQHRAPGISEFVSKVASGMRYAPKLAVNASLWFAEFRNLGAELIELIDAGDAQRIEAKTKAEEIKHDVSTEFEAELLEPLDTLYSNVNTAIADARAKVAAIVAKAENLIDQGRQIAISEIDRLGHKVLDHLLGLLHKLSESTATTTPPGELERVTTIIKQLRNELEAVIGPADLLTESLSDALKEGFDSLSDFAGKAEGIVAQIETAIAAAQNLHQAYEEIVEELELLEEAARRFVDGANRLLDAEARRDLLKPINERVKPDTLEEATGLAVLRAVGAPPVVENLVFNREQIAYYYRAELDRIIVTPMTALLDQGKDVLRALGVAEPVLGIDTEFLSPVTGAFDDFGAEIDDFVKGLEMRANEVLKDLAGLKKLFPRMDYDKSLAKAISIRHGFDKETGQAWLSASMDHRIKRQPIFEQEMFSLVAQNARLMAEARFEQPVTGGEESASTKAEVLLDIVFMVGGTRLLAVREAKVDFSGGGLKFKIRPEKIEFNQLLKLVSDAIKGITGEDSPLQLEMLVDEETGRPIGVASRYDLPPVTFGPILNACLGIHLVLAQRETFRIESLAYLGRRNAPFSLVYGILGGGGYIDASAIYYPETGRTSLSISISIGATAGTGFSFGPLRGSVSIYLGFTLNYVSKTGGQRLIIGAVLVVNGSVRAWSIVTVSLNLRLSVTYDGREMVGVGRITVTVKISSFYKKKFRRSIRYSP